MGCSEGGHGGLWRWQEGGHEVSMGRGPRLGREGRGGGRGVSVGCKQQGTRVTKGERHKEGYGGAQKEPGCRKGGHEG